MRLAVAFDDHAPQVVDVFADRAAETFLGKSWWSQFTRDNVRYLRSSHTLATPGPHLLRVGTCRIEPVDGAARPVAKDLAR